MGPELYFHLTKRPNTIILSFTIHRTTVSLIQLHKGEAKKRGRLKKRGGGEVGVFAYILCGMPLHSVVQILAYIALLFLQFFFIRMLCQIANTNSHILPHYNVCLAMKL